MGAEQLIDKNRDLAMNVLCGATILHLTHNMSPLGDSLEVTVFREEDKSEATIIIASNNDHLDFVTKSWVINK